MTNDRKLSQISREPETGTDVRVALGLRRIINVSGTMTGLGASIAVPDAVEMIARILPQFVEINDLQRRAGEVIARLTGAETGFVTASSAAGITLAVAGAMTGCDLAAIERLPDARGLKDEVVILSGHLVSFGAPIEQSIRLAGARVVPVGQVTNAHGYQLAGAITERTAAALYVVSHHTVQCGQIPLEEFAAIAREKGVPVIVDAASEYDLKGFLAAGGDIAIYSSHKFLGGPTGGIVAGRKELVRATFLQNSGIGRAMKVGKEGIAGTIAALKAWEGRDHAAVRAREMRILASWLSELVRRPGVTAAIVADPTANPLDRLQIGIDPQAARITAWDLADALAAGDPPVIVRDHEIEHGYFQLDPCNLHPGQERQVLARLMDELDKAQRSQVVIATSPGDRRKRRAAALLRWPDR